MPDDQAAAYLNWDQGAMILLKIILAIRFLTFRCLLPMPTAQGHKARRDSGRFPGGPLLNLK